MSGNKARSVMLTGESNKFYGSECKPVPITEITYRYRNECVRLYIVYTFLCVQSYCMYLRTSTFCS